MPFVPRNGRLQIRVTEELSEVSYLDQIHLIAVDHPAAYSLVTSEKWKSPPFPEFQLYPVTTRIHPRRALEDNGRDIASRLAAQDRFYADGFPRDYAGRAQPHTLTLDFGSAAPANDGLLVLHGWVDWADGSTFLSVAQERRGGLQPPSLQVRNQKGEWQTVIEDMGMPDGKPKTIAVDLRGKFLSASREVRIVTNLCVFWDEIYLAHGPRALPGLSRHRLQPLAADLRFRGFSPSKIHPERRQPEVFSYDHPNPVSLWNPTPGLYTRYGDVRQLLSHIDDRLAVMGAGDEVALEFDAASLPPLAPGHVREYLLHVDGWAKDRDANTAFSQTVQPLPFHGMTGYPYGPAERHPHPAYEKEFNTRPALTLIRPLIQRTVSGQ